jgi:uncharacterized protein YeaO (DUF488 family)
MEPRRIGIKRVYESPGENDGTRILVDRLWPRGISKEAARVDLWLRDIAPSDALRKQFHGHPETWGEFREAYAIELADPRALDAVGQLRALAANGPVTLLYAARDEAHNNAEALRLWLNDNPI